MIKKALNALKRRGSELAWRVEELFFENILNIETRGVINNHDLSTASLFKLNSTEYQASYYHKIRRLLRDIQKRGFEKTLFLDVGCGKGRACFYAARLQFDPILGIDFDPVLIAKAVDNLERFRGPNKNIRFLHEDATTYLVPEQKSVIYLGNPFDQKVLKLFIKNNADRIRKYGCVIAYHNDVQRHVLEEVGMVCLFRDPEHNISVWTNGDSC